MKICVITPIYHPYGHGGQEDYTLELVQRLRTRGHQVAVITLGKKAARIPDEGRGEIHQVNRAAFRPFIEASRRPAEWFATHVTEMFSRAGARAVGRLIGNIKPEVIFSQAFYGFGRRMPATLAGLGIPWLHYVHSYDLVCKRQTAVDSAGHACARQCLDCKMVCSFKHGAAPLSKAIVIYNSSYMRKFFEEARMATRESHVIDPVFSCDVPDINAAYNPAAPIRLVFVGRVSDQKGIHLLCDAVAAHPESYRLDVLGDGSLLADLKARHRNAPITFHGRLEPRRRDAVLAQGHALVVPSLWNEPFGRVVQEAYLAGLPVIAAAVGGLRGLIRHGVDGMVFEWRQDDKVRCLVDALDAAAPELPRLRAGALETRARLAKQDTFAAVEDLLLGAAAGKALPGSAAAQPIALEATEGAGL
jgi:glycosyltransferase involved in cell wall biosynthesis